MPKIARNTVEREPTESMPWDRMPGESSRAYFAFCAFRDAGPSRRMDTVWRATETAQGRTVAEHRRAASSWWEWKKRFDWVDRAERYDAHLEIVSRNLHEEQHRGKITAHLERQRMIASTCQTVALQMLRVAAAELQKTVGETKGEHTLNPKQFGQYVRSAAMLATLASEHEAAALGIDELMNILNEPETSR